MWRDMAVAGRRGVGALGVVAALITCCSSSPLKATVVPTSVCTAADMSTNLTCYAANLQCATFGAECRIKCGLCVPPTTPGNHTNSTTPAPTAPGNHTNSTTPAPTTPGNHTNSTTPAPTSALNRTACTAADMAANSTCYADNLQCATFGAVCRIKCGLCVNQYVCVKSGDGNPQCIVSAPNTTGAGVPLADCQSSCLSPNKFYLCTPGGVCIVSLSGKGDSKEMCLSSCKEASFLHPTPGLNTATKVTKHTWFWFW